MVPVAHKVRARLTLVSEQQTLHHYHFENFEGHRDIPLLLRGQGQLESNCSVRLDPPAWHLDSTADVTDRSHSYHQDDKYTHLDSTTNNIEVSRKGLQDERPTKEAAIFLEWELSGGSCDQTEHTKGSTDLVSE
jgi:hypothetical protein